MLLSGKILPLRKFTHAHARFLFLILITEMKNKGLIQRISKLIPFLLALILWCLLVFKEQYFLYKVEDLSAFLFDKLFIAEFFKIPGGFLGLAGSFLTQFLHLPWLGALLWVLLLLMAYHLTIRVFSIPESWHPLALIPIALLVIGNMSLGYGVFIMRTQDHFFAPILGYLIALVPMSLTARIKPLWGKAVFLAFWTTAGFALFGTFAFIGAIIYACNTLVRPGLTRKERITVSASAIALTLLVPVIIYSAYTSYRLAESWIMGLPSISDDSWTHAMRAPFQLALLCQIFLALCSGVLNSKTLDGTKKITAQALAYIVSVAIVCAFWYKDENFHTELEMSYAVDHLEWNHAIDTYQKAANAHRKSDEKAYQSRTNKIQTAHSTDEINDIVERYSSRFFEPTRTMVLYRDLALLKTNRALDEAFTMKDGSRLQNSRTQIPMAWQSGKQFYLQYGLVNMCYRWCLEDIIEHNWSFSTLRYMTMHSVIMQEPELAEKYISKLEKTIFYRRWARGQRALKANRNAMAAAEPYKSILPYMCFENRMSNDMIKTEVYLINHFMEKQPEAATPEYDRAALLIAMRIQDIPRFWERFYYYLKSNPLDKIPLSVQEAAILYSNLRKDGRQFPYDTEVIQSYDEFNTYVQKHAIRSMQESSYPYYRLFGKTFYYYYYFMRDLNTY